MIKYVKITVTSKASHGYITYYRCHLEFRNKINKNMV